MAIELALIALPLAVLMVAAVEFGSLIREYHHLIVRADAAARYLSGIAPSSYSESDRAHVANMVGCSGSDILGENACPRGKPVSAPALTIGQTFCNSTQCFELQDSCGSGCVRLVTVKVENYPYQSLVTSSLVSSIFGGAIKLPTVLVAKPQGLVY